MEKKEWRMIPLFKQWWVKKGYENQIIWKNLSIIGRLSSSTVAVSLVRFLKSSGARNYGNNYSYHTPAKKNLRMWDGKLLLLMPLGLLKQRILKLGDSKGISYHHMIHTPLGLLKQRILKLGDSKGISYHHMIHTPLGLLKQRILKLGDSKGISCHHMIYTPLGLKKQWILKLGDSKGISY